MAAADPIFRATKAAPVHSNITLEVNIHCSLGDLSVLLPDISCLSTDKLKSDSPERLVGRVRGGLGASILYRRREEVEDYTHHEGTGVFIVALTYKRNCKPGKFYIIKFLHLIKSIYFNFNFRISVSSSIFTPKEKKVNFLIIHILLMIA